MHQHCATVSAFQFDRRIGHLQCWRRRRHTFLSQADVALGRLDGSIQTLPNPDLFVLMYVRKQAVLSSQIEGTQSSLQDLLAAEAQLYSPETPKDVDEVVNYVAAMKDADARRARFKIIP
jgi:Fic family protein